MLRFRPMVVPSPVFEAADGATFTLDVDLLAQKGEPPRELGSFGVDAPVEIPLGEVERFSRLTVRMNRGPENRLGPILVLAEAEIGP